MKPKSGGNLLGLTASLDIDIVYLIRFCMIITAPIGMELSNSAIQLPMSLLVKQNVRLGSPISTISFFNGFFQKKLCIRFAKG